MLFKLENFHNQLGAAIMELTVFPWRQLTGYRFSTERPLTCRSPEEFNNVLLLVVLHPIRKGKPFSPICGRGERIRTSDHLNPIQKGEKGTTPCLLSANRLPAIWLDVNLRTYSCEAQSSVLRDSYGPVGDG